jgi:hypothetical protein
MNKHLALFAKVLEEFGNDSKWDGATLGKIKIISNTKVGSVGQLFVERLCGDLGLQCDFPVGAKGNRLSQSSWDIEIMGIKFELKTATEDTNMHFQFNHIRYHRSYEGLLCLGVSPETLHFGIWSKGEVTTGKAGPLVSMEKGANASYKLTKSASQLLDISQFKVEMEAFAKRFGSNGR